MKVLLDACVLYPTVLRELVTGWAEVGGFEPLWSERILDEWRRAAARNGALDATIAEGEIALLKARFPDAMVQVRPETVQQLDLPDPDDNHVLAAAIDGGAQELLTLNVRDFPMHTLGRHDMIRRHPDVFMYEAMHTQPDKVYALVEEVLGRAASYGINTENRRAILKRAKLPRFAKALDQL